MTKDEIINKYFTWWKYDDCVKAFRDFLARGKYFPKENRNAEHLLRCRGNDMLRLSNDEIEDIINNNCAEAFVGKMVQLELWR